MLPTTLTEKSGPESVATIPMQYPSVIPVAVNDSSSATRWRVIGVVSVIISMLIVSAVVLVVRPTINNDATVNAMNELEESWIYEADRQHRQNFEVMINYNDERYIESVHSDDRENIVTFHYTGENGREGEVAVYDFNQGLVAFKDSNDTNCLFASTSSLPNIQVDELQLASRNKEILEISQEVRMYVAGEIPSGFLQRSVGPVFADLCNGLESFWLEEASDIAYDDLEYDDPNRLKRGAGTTGNIEITIGDLVLSFPAGGKVTVIVLSP